jgi:thiopeptide-type bacteriocin biosynthesis protein
VRKLATERLRGYLAAHPSPHSVTAEHYAALCEHLAARENLPSYDRTLRPNDSVADITYRPEYDYYGTGESLEAVERHFVESSQLALRALVGAPPLPQRALMALAMLVLTLATCEPNPETLATWFDTDRVLRTLAGTASDTTKFEAAYQRQRQPLHQDVMGLWTAATRPPEQCGCSEVLGGWQGCIRTLSDRLAALGTQRDTSREILSRCAHLMCNRLGLSVEREIYLRYLLARAISDLTTKN